MPFGIVASIVGSSILGAVTSSNAAGSQAQSAQNATNSQVGMFNQVMGNLSPYMAEGTGALGALNYGLGIGSPYATVGAANAAGAGPTARSTGPGGPGLNPANPAIGAGTASGGTPGAYGWLMHPFGAQDLSANLAPNYNFQLGQGLGAVNNEAAATGMSGNAVTGAQSFAQNYAGNAYQQAFQNYTTNQQNIYGRLGNLAQLGEQASTGGASGAPLFASGISQTIQGLGQANAAGQVGVANALSGGANNFASLSFLGNLLNQGVGA
jgi:hypothetical protein